MQKHIGTIESENSTSMFSIVPMCLLYLYSQCFLYAYVFCICIPNVFYCAYVFIVFLYFLQIKNPGKKLTGVCIL
jgi:hypothetical protein